MDIYRCLRQDHAWQRELANLLQETTSADPDRRRLYERFKQEIDAHVMAEERSFYAIVLCLPNCHLLARRGIFGHQVIVDQIRELNKIDCTSVEWLPAFSRLRNDLDHYCSDEEEFLFPAARQRLHHVTATQLATSYTGLMSRSVSGRRMGLRRILQSADQTLRAHPAPPQSSQ